MLDFIMFAIQICHSVSFGTSRKQARHAVIDEPHIDLRSFVLYYGAFIGLMSML